MSRSSALSGRSELVRPISDRCSSSATAGRAKRKKWNEDSIVAALEENLGEVEAAIARSIFEWARQRHLIPNFGHGALNGSYWPGLDDEAGQMFPFVLRTNGTIVIDFGDMVRVRYRPFDEESKRRDLQRRPNGITGVQIPDAKLDRWPNFISALAEREALAEFIRIMEWTFDEAKEARRAGVD